MPKMAQAVQRIMIMSEENKIDDVLILGCGDVGVRVARLVKQAGGNVSGLARSEDSAERLRSFGLEPVMGNLDDAASLTT